jgi:hypothetical protein
MRNGGRIVLSVTTGNLTGSDASTPSPQSMSIGNEALIVLTRLICRDL